MPLTWHYVCRLFAATRRKEEMASSEGFPLMNFARFLAGLPCFSATEDLKGSACSGELLAEPSSPAWLETRVVHAACRNLVREQPRVAGDAHRTTARSRGGALGRVSPLGQDVAGAKSCRQALADAALARTPSARTTTSPAQIPQSTSSPFLPKRPVSSGETPINGPVPTVVSGH